MGRHLLQTKRNAELFIEVLRSLVANKTFELHDFVIMPDHVHLLLTVNDAITVEKAMQLAKGRFSFRLKREFGVLGEIWQRGFSEVQVMNQESFVAHRKYIAENPVKAGLVDSPEKYPFWYGYLVKLKAEAHAAQQGLKPTSV
jgi:putative transposase